MTILQYAGFLGVTVLAIVLILRAVFFLVIVKSDPLKAIIPRWPKAKRQIEQEISEAS
jgi:uncharacterized membrane protein YqiK